MDKSFFRAAVLSGIIAGMVFLMFEMVMVPMVLGDSVWAPVRMMAAIIMGKGVLPPPATFEFGIFLVALMLHMTLSVIYSSILGWAISKMSMGTSVLTGLVFGLGLYIVNFYGFTAIFDWFAMARNWVSILAHLIFGLTAAYSYKKLYHPTPTMARAA